MTSCDEPLLAPIDEVFDQWEPAPEGTRAGWHETGQLESHPAVTTDRTWNAYRNGTLAERRTIRTQRDRLHH